MFIKVNTQEPYGIVIENGSLEKIGAVVSAIFKPATKVLVVADSNVFPLYGQKVMQSLEKEGLNPFSFTFKAGEESKTLETVSQIYATLTENRFTRTDTIVAVGGGVTGDMAGFAAATYLRGIDFFQVPTSLLAMVDSSIGGKTGVDLPQGKNLVGAFHQPRAVIADPEVLKTLPRDYFIDGLGEVVKYGCIDDIELFEQLETGFDMHNMEDIIFRCADSKRRFVEEDANDKGNRMLLNFGHTFGHAIEKLHNFKGISHGRAVAIGMYIACTIGESLSITEKGTAQRLKDLLVKLELPCDDIHTLEEIVDATDLDKKSMGKMLNIIFLKEMGKAIIKQEERNYLVLKIKILMEKNK